MNIYELMNFFWTSAEEEPFSPSETALYFFLLNWANTQRWHMPFKCPTSAICMSLGTSKQNVLNIRARLIERGMIIVEQGVDKRHPATYSFVVPTDVKSPNGQLNGQPNRQLQLTLYNNKNIDNTIMASEKNLRDIKDLRMILAEDFAWHTSVITALDNDSIRTTEDIHLQLSQFFLQLEAKGTGQRTAEDCKAHFYNWLNKRINNNKYNHGTKQYASRQTQHGTVENCVGTAKSYEGRF